MQKLWFCLTTLLLSLSVQATTISVGQPLPPLQIQNHGELLLEGDEVSYRPWQSEQTRGRITLVQHLAARLSVKDLYKPLNDALEAAAPSPDKFIVTAIVNLDDALWGTSGMAFSEMKDNKRKHPTASIIADKDGAGLAAWKLQEKGGALILLDAEGRVIYFKQGALTEAETEQLVTEIVSRVEASSSAVASSAQ